MKRSLRVHVAAGAVVIYQGKVLLLRINRPKHRHGTWGLPGGKVDLGESLEGGMMREVLEETGITADQYTHRYLGMIHERADAVCKHVFLVELKKDIQNFSYNLREILDVRWVPLDMAVLEQFQFRAPWILPLLQDIAAQSLPASGLPIYNEIASL